MYKSKKLVILLVCLSAVSISNAENIIYVDVNGPNDPGTGTFNDPFRKIQYAIDDANDSDIVEIRPGIYTADPNNYNLDPNGKAIIIRSIEPNDPNIVANTIIDPNGAGRGFYFHSGEDANCIVAGLTIRNANSVPGYNGGSVYCYYSDPTIRNCIIENGRAGGSGGGFFCDYSKSSIINCTITGNSAEYYGGGISCIFSDLVIVGCMIAGNAAVEGGGIDNAQGNPTIINCVVTDNKASSGGGVSCYYRGETNLINCTVTKNSATNAGGALCCQYESSATIDNSILWANEANQGTQLALMYEGSASVGYCNVQGEWAEVYDPCDNLDWRNGNMDADPCFATFDPNGDPNMWDFHLRSMYGRWDGNSQSWVADLSTSPCIDAGDPNSDWAVEPWPNGKRINMGAYGGTSQASMNGNRADFDVDGSVDFIDFAEFANKWLEQEFCIQDLSADGVVEFADLRVFAENWLWKEQ
ncbi:MAG: hypothetical protein JSV82_06520 [Planctomycetota bacterium]|nr:MAG: hypothetical protein JSV82_06520 [Planctomycetota bacterium]